MTYQSLDFSKIRNDFPVLSTKVDGKPLVYLDSAATAQKPQCVIDAMSTFYSQAYGTVHRGIYTLSQKSTESYDHVREQVAKFLNAKLSKEVVFTRGCTESINLVASGYVQKVLKPGDEILISEIEHHANFVPWQKLCEKMGFVLKLIPVNDLGELDMVAYERLLTPKTAFVAIVHISNVLGSINPIKKMTQMAHSVGAKVLIDGAQSVPHLAIDVQALDCDFFCFSSHKLFGPTGLGVLYAPYGLLEEMDPHLYGGDMIESVTFKETVFAKPPLKFEAGTPAITEVIGLGSAIDYLLDIGLSNIHDYETELLEYAVSKLKQIPELRIIGEAADKASVISFLIGDIHPHDIGTILDDDGIAIRAGHHCSQPTMTRFGISATARASFSFYNNRSDIDRLIEGLHKVRRVML